MRFGEEGGTHRLITKCPGQSGHRPGLHCLTVLGAGGPRWGTQSRAQVRACLGVQTLTFNCVLECWKNRPPEPPLSSYSDSSPH